MKPNRIRFVGEKSVADLDLEWDEIALVRRQQISDGTDLSLTKVLFPYVLGAALQTDPRQVIDVGCGTGELSALLAERVDAVTGVDRSGLSIAVARQTHKMSNLEYVHAPFENLSAPSGGVDVVTMNMVLMDCPALSPLLQAARRWLRPGGYLIATITHPVFWPIYWEYADHPDFSYLHEVAVEAEFTISLGTTGHTTTHFHRPLQTYIQTVVQSGFTMISLDELFPKPEVHSLYPRAWKFPRFVGLVAQSAMPSGTE